MEQTLKKSLSIALLICAIVSNAVADPVVSLFKIRPQSLNGARKVSGEVPGSGLTHLPDMDEWYANFWIAPAYQKTFRPGNIAHTLFDNFLVNTPAGIGNGCDNECGESILIQGLNVNDGKPNPLAWRAEDFYLGDDYNGFLTFKPTISNFILDFNFYAGFDEWVQGLYLRVYAPFVHTKWNLHMKETIISYDDLQGNTEIFLPTATAYFAGAQPPQGAATVVASPLAFNQMNGSRNGALNTANDPCDTSCDTSCGSSETRNGFGEIRAEFGWDFLRNEDYHLGVFLAAAAPTGNKPCAKLLFSPLVGNGKHWELGGGLTGHWVFWRSEDEASHVGFYSETTVTHLFNAKEQRVFDLVGKPLSRYMLAAKMTQTVDHKLSGTDVAGNTDIDNEETTTRAQYQWSGEYSPVANLTVQDVNVSVGAQVDLTAWFNYTAGGFSWDLGYNLWLQTCEKFGCTNKCGPVLADGKNIWVLKGKSEATGKGFEDTNDYALSFSDNTAMINIGEAPEGGFSFNNTGIDNSTKWAINETEVDGVETPQILIVPNEEANVQMHLSLQPEFIKLEDIDKGQKAKGLSNKIFTHFAYTWDRDGVVPFIGIGGEAEFGSGRCAKSCTEGVVAATPMATPVVTTTGDNCKKSCEKTCETSCCINNAVSQWGVWLKVGVQFD